MKKVELLAPAGNFQSLEGAICAGADAVYLAGNRFGARAYADNFTTEELCKGIRMAHIHGKKIYLTVNILIKQKEINDLVEFLQPLYEYGLDGVIVQDLGAVRFIQQHFSELPIHASTQMTITGSNGAEFLKESGISRIVPARELSLQEVRRIKEETGMEMETFIHGAMCYSYSGQCLFSSILGGRSGNRGRCAQPCRLPYSLKNQKECYPLSMKDMCTLDLIPELIEAGIDSFKIEGRMKRPEYAAGVTSIYRKYIDLYYSKEPYHISEDDRKFLHSLYIRSEVGEGYYHQKNGENMITLTSPAYSETSEQLLAAIQERFLKSKERIGIDALLTMKEGRPALLQLSCENTKVTVLGEAVSKALKQPLTEEALHKQLDRMGNTEFFIRNLCLDVDDNIFYPVRELNELRRKAVKELEDAIIQSNGLPVSRGIKYQSVPDEINIDANGESVVNEKRNNSGRKFEKDFIGNVESRRALDVVVASREQLDALLDKDHLPIRRIYLDYTLLTDQAAMTGLRNKWSEKLFLAGPYVIRQHNQGDLTVMKQAMESGHFQGILFRNLETYVYMSRLFPNSIFVPDHNLYFWNRETIRFWEGRISEFYLPVEQNRGEWKELLAGESLTMKASALVYGRIPMMITANCIENTSDGCRHQSGISYLTDRYHTKFPVLHNCRSCYNVIYNCVPLSLHSLVGKGMHGLHSYRLDFTTESAAETSAIVRYFSDLVSGMPCEIPYKEYTTGHIKRGVE